jgi:hypothetical protein
MKHFHHFCSRRLAAALSTIAIVLLVHAGAAQAQITPAAGYWWNPATAGEGFVIEVQGNQMFMAGFLYATNGEATWVASVGPMMSATQYSGSLITYNGGQTLTGSYQAPNLSPSLGTLSLNFTDASHASLTWPGGTVAVERFDFGPGGSEAVPALTTPEVGWWWNPAEGGRGFAIEIQGNAMYFAGYMYDPNGNALWYLASGNMTSPNVFQGTWTQYQNGPALTGAYKAPTLANANVGPVNLTFTDTHTAVLTLPNGADIPLVRFAFGSVTPTLTSFSPATAAPASTLTLTGTGFNPAAEITVIFSNSNGNYNISVPPSSVTSSTVNVTVPPFVNSFSNNFSSGTVNVTLTQKANGVSLNTNTLSGFNIGTLPSPTSQAGNGTLALMSASLQEAQRLETTPQVQANAQTLAAVQIQVQNLQTLVTSVQNVLQKGQSFDLGVVGGVDLTVTASNILDVDQLILATLQSLSGTTGSTEKGAEQAGAIACLAAEAAAFAEGMTTGANLATLQQLATNLVQATGNSSACATVSAFTPAYRAVGGASGTGYGFSNAAGTRSLTQRLPGAALFATAVETAEPQLSLNALAALAGQTTAVQNTIENVQQLGTPVTNAFINQATGQLITAIIGAENVLDNVAPPPPGAATSTITGTWSGTWSWIAGSNGCVFNDGGLVSMNLTQNGSTITGTNINVTGFQIRLDSNCAFQYVDIAQAGTLNGTLSGNTFSYTASLPLVQFGQPFLWSGTATFNGISNTINGVVNAYGTTGSFTLTRQ